MPMEEHRGALTAHCRRIRGRASRRTTPCRRRSCEPGAPSTTSRAGRRCGRGSVASPPTCASTCSRLPASCPPHRSRLPPAGGLRRCRALGCRRGCSRSPAALPPGPRGPGRAGRQREAVRRAVVASLLRLPPRQHAVLILREVLRWNASRSPSSSAPPWRQSTARSNEPARTRCRPRRRRPGVPDGRCAATAVAALRRRLRGLRPRLARLAAAASRSGIGGRPDTPHPTPAPPGRRAQSEGRRAESLISGLAGRRPGGERRDDDHRRHQMGGHQDDAGRRVGVGRDGQDERQGGEHRRRPHEGWPGGAAPAAPPAAMRMPTTDHRAVIVAKPAIGIPRRRWRAGRRRRWRRRRRARWPAPAAVAASPVRRKPSWVRPDPVSVVGVLMSVVTVMGSPSWSSRP